jgi:tetratricopeptide (TPR) repeat protein
MNQIHNHESPAPSTSCATRTSLRRLYAIEGRVQLTSAAPLELATWLMPLFEFLPKPISFEVSGDDLVIRYPSEAGTAKIKARELLNRAVKRASQGNYEAVARLCLRALEKQPSLHEARRILARACMELNDLAQAKHLLVQVASCDPDDTWALAALASVCLREGDNERAERFTTLSLSTEPRNAEALTNLGMLYHATGRAEDAVEVLQQAIEIAPAMPDPRYALAKLFSHQGKFKECTTVVEGLFASAKPITKASARIFESARGCYAVCQKELAQQGHEAALRSIRELQDQTEKLVGCPIRISYEEPRGVLGSAVPMVMARDSGEGVIKCRLEGPENARPCLVAGALLRLQADWEAARAGQKRRLVVTDEQMSRLLSLFGPSAGHQSREDRSLFNVVATEMAWVPFYTLLGSAPQMWAELRMKQRFPELRPSQFLSLSQGFLDNWHSRELLKTARLPKMPRLVERTILALCGLDALFLDDLLGGTTDLAARCQGAEGFDLSKRLWQHWRSKSASMKPGDEYAALEDFTEILGLSDWCGWAEAPFFGGEAQGFPSM